ncbi:MAG: M4 family metallopeptidase, partial [Anaerolineales bacterium]
LDNANLAVRGITHPVRREDVFRFPNNLFPELYCNAFYFGDGLMIFGEGLPFPVGGQTCDFLAGALDVVAHELTHGVTDYSSRLIYRNESGALNEAISDIMGTAVEFFYQAPGSGPLRADYLIGEDVLVPGGIRSLPSPSVFGDRDHYSIRFLGAEDNGGVHINSTIVGHAYYLAVEGGTNRVSGLAVQGVGTANREQVERVFYRAFMMLLTPAANFAQARAATIQAARDVFGSASPAERAVTQAWTAVGVN